MLLFGWYYRLFYYYSMDIPYIVTLTVIDRDVDVATIAPSRASSHRHVDEE